MSVPSGILPVSQRPKLTLRLSVQSPPSGPWPWGRRRRDPWWSGVGCCGFLYCCLLGWGYQVPDDSRSSGSSCSGLFVGLVINNLAVAIDKSCPAAGQLLPRIICSGFCPALLDKLLIGSGVGPPRVLGRLSRETGRGFGLANQVRGQLARSDHILLPFFQPSIVSRTSRASHRPRFSRNQQPPAWKCTGIPGAPSALQGSQA